MNGTQTHLKSGRLNILFMGRVVKRSITLPCFFGEEDLVEYLVFHSPLSFQKTSVSMSDYWNVEMFCLTSRLHDYMLDSMCLNAFIPQIS